MTCKQLIAAIVATCALTAVAAPAPYPVTINSRSPSAPPLMVFAANQSTFRASFVDGDAASDLTGCTPFMAWATNASASVVSTAAVSVVGISTGLVDFTFSPAAVNYAAGRYIYEIGVVTGSVTRVFRQGVFTIHASPSGGGAAAVDWATPIAWSTVSWIGLPDYALASALTAESLARLSGDLAAMTNWQAVVYSMTNGAALGETALQPAATNTLAAAAAHAATEHSVTEDGGFQAGTGANATTGGAVGYSAGATDGGGAVGSYATGTYGGGAVGNGAYATDGGGAVGASTSAAFGGGAVGLAASAASGGGAVGANAKTSDGFAGGKDAFATSDGTFDGEPIDAIQIGSGGNSTPLTLQIYTNRLLNADGTIPIERMSLHDGDETAHPDIRETITSAPEWIGVTNLSASVTVTNVNERPIYLYSTGTVSLAISGLRTPMPLYLIVRGPDSLTIPGAYYIGGGKWQTNMSNHFVVWTYGTNLFVNPVTASED